jgi:putative aminopeptidase FrvX
MNIQLLKRLSESLGPPGTEDEPRSILRRELEPFADEVRIDKLGNIFFTHKGKQKSPKLMIAAHTDEVAVLISYIEDTGVLRFYPWGIVDGLLLGQRFKMNGKKGTLYGVVGSKPPHVMNEQERKKPVPADQLFIDIGASSREEAEIKGAFVGMAGVFDTEFRELGNDYVMGKALDDRAGCFVLAEVFKWLKDQPYNVVAVGTVQEEVGLRGSRTAAWQVDPDFGLALEGTFAVDMPGVAPHQQSASLKQGPVVTVADRSVIVHPQVLRGLIDAAESEGIPYQFKKVPTGGTDAGSIHLTKAGIPSGTVACPCRYIHGPAAITTLKDLENTIKLVKAFIKQINK